DAADGARTACCLTSRDQESSLGQIRAWSSWSCSRRRDGNALPRLRQGKLHNIWRHICSHGTPVRIFKYGGVQRQGGGSSRDYTFVWRDDLLLQLSSLYS